MQLGALLMTKKHSRAGITHGRQFAEFRDNMQSYSNTEPAIDLTAASPLAFAWRMSGQ